MTSIQTFTFFGKIADRDQFDQLARAIETSVRMSKSAEDYLIEAATSGKPTSIMGGNRSRLSAIADACEEAGLSYNVTELDEANVAMRRECWRPGAAKPFTVELTPNGEPAFTSEQIRDAIQSTGNANILKTLQRWANSDGPATFEIDADLIDELRPGNSLRR